MSKYTPGPWEINENLGIGMGIAITNSIKEDICFCEPFYGKEEANAHLIASAPELLEAVKGLLTNCPSPAAIEQAGQAITKAEGGK